MLVFFFVAIGIHIIDGLGEIESNYDLVTYRRIGNKKIEVGRQKFAPGVVLVGICAGICVLGGGLMVLASCFVLVFGGVTGIRTAVISMSIWILSKFIGRDKALKLWSVTHQVIFILF